MQGEDEDEGGMVYLGPVTRISEVQTSTLPVTLPWLGFEFQPRRGTSQSINNFIS